MSEEKINEDIEDILNELIEEIENEKDFICSQCSSKKTNQNGRYLCEKCSIKREDDTQKLLKDFQSLAEEVEQRLEAIENTERELDRWRDEQLQKNRDFWDEYRRQVENFSACRIRTLQYEYTMKQLRNETIVKRLKRAKFFSENLEEFRDQLNDLIEPSLIQLISSENFQNQFQLFFSNNDEERTTTDQRKDFLQQLEQLSSLDQISFPENQSCFDQIIYQKID